MTEFQNKSFSVYPGGTGGQEYRDNWDRVFGKGAAADRPSKERCPWCSRTLPSFGRCECREQVVAAPVSYKEKEPEPTVEPEPLLCEWCGADYFECICAIRI